MLTNEEWDHTMVKTELVLFKYSSKWYREEWNCNSRFVKKSAFWHSSDKEMEHTKNHPHIQWYWTKQNKWKPKIEKYKKTTEKFSDFTDDIQWCLSYCWVAKNQNDTVNVS